MDPTHIVLIFLITKPLFLLGAIGLIWARARKNAAQKEPPRQLEDASLSLLKDTPP